MNFDWTISVPVLIALASFVFTWRRTRQTDLDGRFKSLAQLVEVLSQRVDAHDLRAAALEATVKNLPGKDDLHALHLDIARMGGALGRMEAVMEGNAKIMGRLENIVSRHEDHLLGNSKR